MSSSGNDRFSQEALEWDLNPKHLEASKLALEAIQRHIPELGTENGKKKLDVIEIGCGTGLLTLLVAPHVRSVIGVDTAEGMISALGKKIVDGGIENVRAVKVLLEDPNDRSIQLDPLHPSNESSEDRRFDLVTSHLVLHHIADLAAVFKTMYGLLKEGGRIALTDYEDCGAHSKSFHPAHKMGGVERHGIPRGQARDMLESAGFSRVQVETAFTLEKEVEGENGVKRVQQFPFLICLGQK